VACAALAALWAPSNARAQAASGAPEPDSRPQEYAWSAGIGAGLVQPDNGSETYWQANLRRRLRTRSADDAVTGQQASEGLKAFLEAEVGYWKATTATTENKDLLLGLNLIGTVPTRAADMFIGVGFGAHFVDASLIETGSRATTSDTRFGGNVQFGVEVRLSERFGLWGAGRVDFLSGERDRKQSKITGGLRARF
jgi:hypothetical protein